MRRPLLAVTAVLAAIAAQVTVVNRLSLPGGAGPDLVLVVVVTLALVSGPRLGALIGFAAGLVLDVTPPASHLIGQSALVLCLIGYGVGRLRAPLERSAWMPLAGVAVGVVAGQSLSAGVGQMFGNPDVTWGAIRAILPACTAYSLLISPFVLYGVVRLGRYHGWTPGRPGRFSAPLAGQEQAVGRPAAGASAGLAALGAAAAGAVRDTGSGSVPRLAASARAGDGWVGGRSPGMGEQAGPWVKRRRPLALRARGGVAGSAAGQVQLRSPPPARPVRLRANSLRRGGGLIGRSVTALAGGALYEGAGTPGAAGLGRRTQIRGSAFRGAAAKGAGGGQSRPAMRARAFRFGRTAALPAGGGWAPRRMRARAFRQGSSAPSPTAGRLKSQPLRIRRRRRDGVIGGSVLGKSASGAGSARAGSGGASDGRSLRPGAFAGGGPGRSAAAFWSSRAPGGSGPRRWGRAAGAVPRFRGRRGVLRWATFGLAGRGDELGRLGRRGGRGMRVILGAGPGPAATSEINGHRGRSVAAVRRWGRPGWRVGRPGLLGVGRRDGVIGGSVLGRGSGLARGAAGGAFPSRRSRLALRRRRRPGRVRPDGVDAPRLGKSPWGGGIRRRGTAKQGASASRFSLRARQDERTGPRR